MSEKKPVSVGEIIPIVIISILIVIIIIAILTPKRPKAVPNSVGYASCEQLKLVEGSDVLYYDTRTSVVYIVIYNTGYESMAMGISPYLHPNGLPYTYENGKLVEPVTE